jgi:UDP-N-acetylglucosamine acyltransferase
MSEIDPRAAVSPRARLGAGVRVGAFAVIGDEVELGAGCVVMPSAVLQGPARFGTGNIFHPCCSVGGDPQDLKFSGERTELVVGNENTFREFVTVNRGTGASTGVTRIGSNNLFMAYAHVAHDCNVGDRTIFANGATLAGHVDVHDHATVGAYCTIHQFTRIGRYAYIGALTALVKDAPPFSLVVAEREVHCYGPNSVGIERAGFGAERMQTIERAFRLLLRAKLNTTQAVAELRKKFADSADVRELVEFIESSQRGVIK